MAFKSTLRATVQASEREITGLAKARGIDPRQARRDLSDYLQKAMTTNYIAYLANHNVKPEA